MNALQQVTARHVSILNFSDSRVMASSVKYKNVPVNQLEKYLFMVI